MTSIFGHKQLSDIQTQKVHAVYYTLYSVRVCGVVYILVYIGGIFHHFLGCYIRNTVLHKALSYVIVCTRRNVVYYWMYIVSVCVVVCTTSAPGPKRVMKQLSNVNLPRAVGV